MAESQSGFDEAEYKTNLDSACAKIMPDDWPGHARLKIRESELTGEAEEFAINLAERLLEKGKKETAESAAVAAVKAAKEKL